MGAPAGTPILTVFGGLLGLFNRVRFDFRRIGLVLERAFHRFVASVVGRVVVRVSLIFDCGDGIVDGILSRRLLRTVRCSASSFEQLP
jgi:hypothetical protein